MRFPGIAYPEQLKTLRMALDEYCIASDIRPGTQAYEDAARHIIALFNSGAFEVPAAAGYLSEPATEEGTPTGGET